ncbi:hypothetical protein MOQ72_07080 [Saccharopolyspora sp. K220]|uniref:hypothetical protein n=1 Tax=Saccharopolyspora soli TaxID=2926618 RepID=UPI001F5954B1|nr:hypothetical protein [Saccharopolyspora soli]MCI2417180.1 hypothetical protein [Saccharopolyspora soli]
MTAVSENAKAFRNHMEGMVRENAASRRVIEESWQDSAKAADKSSKELSEKGQKLVERIRERAANMRKAEESAKLQEIAVGEEPETEDADPEVERFSQHLYAQQQSKAAAEEPAATTAESAQSAQPEWQARSGRFGQPAAAPPEPARPAPEQNSGWNVQAGRFGRRNQQPTPPPAAPPPPPAPPKPAPRRRPAVDDDDDYENQSWLR